MRRWIAGAAVGLGLLLAAPTARADGPQWNGSRITTETTSASESFVLAAQFFRAQNNLGGGTFTPSGSFTIPSGLPSQCGAPGTVALPTPSYQGNVNEQPWVVTAPYSVECNGTYSFEIVATFKPSLGSNDVKRLPGTITVAAPPPNVQGVEAKLDGSRVVVTWDALSNEPADFTGWRVERVDASGTSTTLTVLGPNAPRTFTDESPPPEGGEVTYRVRATRAGPSGDIASEGGGRSKAVDLPVATTTSTPGATDAGTTDGGTAGTGGTAGADGGTTTGGTSGTTGGTTRSTPRFNKGRGVTGVGIPAPRLGESTGSGLLLSPDEGFDEEIDYGELPGADEEGAGDDLEIFDESSGRGLAVPIGIGAVLFGWGLHLFFLARAARPATVAVPVLDDLYDDVPTYDEPSYGGSGYGSSTGYGSGYGSSYSSYSSFGAYDDDH